MTDVPERLVRWLECHPLTMLWVILMMVVLNFVLAVLDAIGVF